MSLAFYFDHHVPLAITIRLRERGIDILTAAEDKLAMPIFLRRLFLNDLHHMFLYYEVQKGPRGTPEAFKKVVPDALSAEDWFRFHGRYSNGEKIAAEAGRR